MKAGKAESARLRLDSGCAYDGFVNCAHCFLKSSPMSSTNALEVLIQALRRLPGWGQVCAAHGVSLDAA